MTLNVITESVIAQYVINRTGILLMFWSISCRKETDEQPKRIKKYSPLTETTFYILISLLEPLHGYGIMQKVEKLSDGNIRLGPGTLYGALSNLVEAKLIILQDSSRDPGGRRKVYSITEFGIELIRFEIKRLEVMLKNGKQLLKGRKQ